MTFSWWSSKAKFDFLPGHLPPILLNPDLLLMKTLAPKHIKYVSLALCSVNFIMKTNCTLKYIFSMLHNTAFTFLYHLLSQQWIQQMFYLLNLLQSELILALDISYIVAMLHIFIVQLLLAGTRHTKKRVFKDIFCHEFLHITVLVIIITLWSFSSV